MKQENISRDLVLVPLFQLAIYVALTITPPLNAYSYGAYQFRNFCELYV